MRLMPLFVWAPRVVGIAVALFLAMFALDVFNESRGVAQTAVALLMHLVPAAIVASLVAIAWRRELAGAIGFAALGVAYIAIAGGRFPWTVYAAVAGPMFVTAVLFAMAWSSRRHRRAAAPTNR